MINRYNWIIVGILLWGIPAAVLFSMMVALLEPGSWMKIQQFDWTRFTQSLVVFGPVFLFLGLILGLVMDRITDRYRKKNDQNNT